MGVIVTDNTRQVIDELNQKTSIFLRVMTDKIVDYARPNTPKKEGRLREGTIKTVQGPHARIEWRKAYATVQERGSRKDGTYKIKNYSTPGTGPHYAEDAVKKGVANTSVVAKLVSLI